MMRTIGITGSIGSGKSFVASRMTKLFGIPVYDCDTEAKRLMEQDDEIRQRLVRLLGNEVYNTHNTINKPLLADFIFKQGGAKMVNEIVHPAVRKDFERWQSHKEQQLQSFFNRQTNFYSELYPPFSEQHLPFSKQHSIFSEQHSTCSEQYPMFSGQERTEFEDCQHPNDSHHANNIVAIESAILIEAGFNTLCNNIMLVCAPLELRIQRVMKRSGLTHQEVMARISAQLTEETQKKYADIIIQNDNTGNLDEALQKALLHISRHSTLIISPALPH